MAFVIPKSQGFQIKMGSRIFTNLMAGEMKSFTNDDSILSDPNIFIADTGATTNSSPHGIRIMNVKDAKASDSVTGVSGSSIQSNKTGDLLEGSVTNTVMISIMQW